MLFLFSFFLLRLLQINLSYSTIIIPLCLFGSAIETATDYYVLGAFRSGCFCCFLLLIRSFVRVFFISLLVCIIFGDSLVEPRVMQNLLRKQIFCTFSLIHTDTIDITAAYRLRHNVCEKKNHQLWRDHLFWWRFPWNQIIEWWNREASSFSHTYTLYKMLDGFLEASGIPFEIIVSFGLTFILSIKKYPIVCIDVCLCVCVILYACANFHFIQTQ